MVLQCPECALRFRFESELETHLRDEHPEFRADPKSAAATLRRPVPRHKRQHYDSSH